MSEIVIVIRNKYGRTYYRPMGVKTLTDKVKKELLKHKNANFTFNMAKEYTVTVLKGADNEPFQANRAGYYPEHALTLKDVKKPFHVEQIDRRTFVQVVDDIQVPIDIS